MTLLWGVLITGLVILVGLSVTALMLLGAALWIVDWLMQSIERLEPMPPLEPDERETLEEQGRGWVRGLLEGIRIGKHR